MLRVAHIGPPLARQGGPGGYLLQLHYAACEAGRADLMMMPPMAPAHAPRRRSARERVRSTLGRMKRTAVGPARQRRPSDELLGADHGHIERVMIDTRTSLADEARASLAAGLAAQADVLFCHDSTIAELALQLRRPSQQVWLMLHAPMPLALYLIWNWGVPERDWRDVMSFPDVHRWTRWEIDVWRAVDRLILPCSDALEELVRIDSTVASVTTPISWVLSGASAAATRADNDRDSLRRAWKLPIDRPVGLYLGNNQAYRALDALTAAAHDLDSQAPAGIVAVAGPPREAVSRHPRLRALGHVSDVGGLLAAVDFVINVNRFSLFDLSTIEALEASKPLLLHAVGGNKTFNRLGAGAEMIPDLDRGTIAAGLVRLFEMSEPARDALAAMSRRCYDAHLTRAHLWARHEALYAGQSAAVAAS